MEPTRAHGVRFSPTWAAVLVLALLAGPTLAAVGTWSPLGPFGAPLRFLALDPDSPSHLVAATQNGNLYRAPAGESWMPVDDFAGGPVCSLVSAPGVFLLTTLEGQASQGTLWRSSDGGASWTATPGPMTTDTGFCFTLAAVDGDILYAVAADQPFRSDDGGTSWTLLDTSPITGGRRDITVLAMAPSDSARLFLAVDDRDTARVTLYRSADSGATWTEASQGLPRDPSEGAYTIAAVAVDPATPATVWTAIGSAGLLSSLYRSTDGGDNWQAVPGPPASFFNDNDLSIVIDPSQPGTLFVTSLSSVLRTTDGGASWTQFGIGAAPVLGLAVVPDASATVYAATEVGPFRSPDGGDNWFAFNAGLPAYPARALAVDPQDPDRLYAGVTSFGVMRSDDRGASWDLAATVGQVPFPLNLVRVAVDPHDSSVVQAAGDARLDGVYSSTDGARTFFQNLTVDRFEPVRGLAITPSGTVYASSGAGVFKSEDRGATWRFFDGGLTDTRVLAVDPTTRDLYAAGDGVHRSTNGGRTWFAIANELPDDVVLSLAVDPTEPRVLYAGTASSGVYRTDDLGASWTPTSLPTGLAVNDLAIDPRHPAIVYAATDAGIFRTSSRGASWKPLAPASLGDPTVHRVALGPVDPRHVYAATEGGVYAIEVVESSVLDLRGGRFTVEVEWRDFQSQRGAGTVALVTGDAAGPVALRSRDSAVVGFFSPGNWEMLLKVLDGTAINGHYWVFFAAATNVGFTTTVTDTSCGDVKVYINPLGLAAPAVTDVTAFAGCGDPAPPSCVAAGGVLCLGRDGRFRVEIEWTDFQGHAGAARQVDVAGPGLARSADSGLFYFFSEDNWELLVKVLDGCAINDRFWVFGAATTDVAYTLKVTDTATGAQRTYANPLGVAAAAITDTGAYATCDVH